MTMFERDFVERLESVIGWKPISESHSIADAILNEFMRLNKRIAELEQEGADKDEYIVRTGITILSKLDEPLKALEEFKNRITKLEELLDIVDDKKQTVFEILTNTIARRDKRIEELEQERRWIPINEPPDRQDTRQKLLIDKNEEWSGLGVAEWNFGWCDQISRPDGEYRWVTCGNRPFTHWQHLPQPPKEVTNETTYLI